MKLQWSNEYELGINVIDNQHKRIVDYINELEAMRLEDASNEHMEQLFEQLVEYTESHFAFEESLLEDSGYPKLAEHQRTHKVFIAQLSTLLKSFSEGDDVRKELLDMLTNWLLDHILNDDRDYSELVKKCVLAQNTEEHASWVKRATKRFFGSLG